MKRIKDETMEAGIIIALIIFVVVFVFKGGC
jgi:hypothetical protein